MGIAVSINGLSADDLTGKQAKGALNSDDVMVQFICNTGEEEDEHDPDKPPDSKVRPAHAALHGTVWKVNEAPAPPLSYGCRCCITYLARAGSDAAELLPLETDEIPEVSPIKPQEIYLNDNFPKWEDIAKKSSKVAPQLRVAESKKVAKSLGYPADIADMALSAAKVPMKPSQALGTSDLAGLGAAGKRLVAKWEAGDVAAAKELAQKYPQTYRRLLVERPELALIVSGSLPINEQ